MKFGNLEFNAAETRTDLSSEATRKSIEKNQLQDVLVAEIDPSVSDTVALDLKKPVETV